MNYREKMREYLKEPNEICNHYGKWGILNKEQRDLITRLLNEMDVVDNYIIKLQQENKRLKDKLSKIETLIINHNCDTGEIYYKYNGKFLKSELKQRILEIVYEERVDSNE